MAAEGRHELAPGIAAGNEDEVDEAQSEDDERGKEELAYGIFSCENDVKGKVYCHLAYRRPWKTADGQGFTQSPGASGLTHRRQSKPCGMPRANASKASKSRE